MVSTLEVVNCSRTATIRHDFAGVGGTPADGQRADASYEGTGTDRSPKATKRPKLRYSTIVGRDHQRQRLRRRSRPRPMPIAGARTKA